MSDVGGEGVGGCKGYNNELGTSSSGGNTSFAFFTICQNTMAPLRQRSANKEYNGTVFSGHNILRKDFEEKTTKTKKYGMKVFYRN